MPSPWHGATGWHSDAVDRKPPERDPAGSDFILLKVPEANDEQVRRLVARCHAARKLLVPVYGLSQWDIKFFYERWRFHKKNEDAAAYAVSEWAYQRASVYFSIHACYDNDWEMQFYVVAHELAHLVVAPVVDHTKGMKNKHVRNAVETVVHRVASSVVAALRVDEIPDPCAETTD